MKKLRILAALILWLSSGICWAGNLRGGYVEPGTEPYYSGLIIPQNIIDSICYEIYWLDYTEVEDLRSPMSYIELEYDGVKYPAAATVISPMKFKEEIDGKWYDRTGACYQGKMVVPEAVYGLNNEDATFPVIGIMDMYKNGLTSLYLPESIEWIFYTIESCRYLERVHLNNSLRELQGVRNCPVLTDCPLPLSLEKIGDGWMSGIAITETVFPKPLTVIGKGGIL